MQHYSIDVAYAISMVRVFVPGSLISIVYNHASISSRIASIIRVFWSFLNWPGFQKLMAAAAGT